jgi:hypothetical protein
VWEVPPTPLSLFFETLSPLSSEEWSWPWLTLSVAEVWTEEETGKWVWGLGGCGGLWAAGRSEDAKDDWVEIEILERGISVDWPEVSTPSLAELE